MDFENLRKRSILIPELYFLITKFLSHGPLKQTAQVLRQELERSRILPKRLDWEGKEHFQTLDELEQKYSHISYDHLLKICSRIGPILDREIPPSVLGVVSLLGAGRQSLLRSNEPERNYTPIVKYGVRWKEKPPLDPIHLKHRTHNIVNVLYGREYSGPSTRKLMISSNLFSKQQLLCRTLGHLSSVYCLLFDRTGLYIITGADDLLVKLWSTVDGRLLNTFRGASAEITDIDINQENSLLAAGSIDRLLRVWDLQTGAPVAVLCGHTGMITSVKFCPSTRSGLRYLITTSNDGSVAFWTYTYNKGKANFMSRPLQYHERLRPGQAQMICASFSPGGMFLAAGSADHHVRVYLMHGDEGPHRILELEAHSDTVDSIQWAHHGLRFISGSKDGTAHVWHFDSQQWKSHQLLMSTRLPGTTVGEEENKKLKVTMVAWDCTDCWVITAVNDHSLKVWNAETGKLTKVLNGHHDEVFALESHPFDENVILSAGHDGQICIWDIQKGIILAKFVNTIEGQGHGAVFDAKWSPDGNMIAATDSHGHILMFGFGTNERMKNLPKELFFHTDYRPLVRDNQQGVLDEQTQTPPHLMPPPFLVDLEGNPYPPYLQRLVPGRERCPGEQLIPNIAFGDGGEQEIIEGLPAQEPRSDIDLMIAALAHRQYGERDNGDGNNDQDDNSSVNRHLLNSPRNGNRGLRRHGDVEGVRQSSGNWQHDANMKWHRHLLVKPLSPYALDCAKQKVDATGTLEIEMYRREMRRRPVMIKTAAIVTGAKAGRTRGVRRNRPAPAYRTRAVRSEQLEEAAMEEDQASVLSESPSESAHSDDDDSTAKEEELQPSGSSTSDSESSGYSDWVADHGVTLEPPKRSKRKPVKKPARTPSSDPDDKPLVNIKKEAKIPSHIIEVPEAYRPPEWLSETIPRKAPYYPQMGDEVMYFMQGHQLYLNAAKAKNVYEIGPRSEPWLKTKLRATELVKVVGIKYEIKPPRLCCLKLGLMNEKCKLTGETFTIKYHDMADVLDFFVLKQTFDVAMNRNWQPGMRFRCMIDDGWWLGTIESQSPISDVFPDSPFMCFRVRWDNGEYEHMSPWDLEPINPNRMPDTVGGAVPVLPEEIQAILYQPQTEEWPGSDRVATCRRIINGIDQVMSLAIAEPFSAPVDLNHYPSYAFVVEYPIDLSTIKARFENHFYRRITSAQFDVRYLATNAEKFNELHSQIVKKARIVTDLCLRIIKDRNDVDVGAVYHQLVDTYISSDSEDEVEVKKKKKLNGSEQQPSTSGLSRLNMRSSKRLDRPEDWKKEALNLLEALWRCEDSTPFREPVDRLEHPDYHQMIDTPMDLQTVKEDLLGNNYPTPNEFCKDVRLIFQNSRNFNTNKRSKIYSMTIRLSAMFEEHARTLIYNWKSARRRSNTGRRRKTTKTTTPSSASKKMNTRNNGIAGPSKLRELSTSEDEDDLSTQLIPAGRANANRRTNPISNTPQSSSRLSETDIKTTRTTNGLKICLPVKPNSSEPSDSSYLVDSDDEPIKKRTPRGRGRPRKQRSDSEDSYKPNRVKGKALINKKTPFKNRPKRKKVFQSNSDDDDDSADSDFEVTRRSGIGNKRRKLNLSNTTNTSEGMSDAGDVRKRAKRKVKADSDFEYEVKPTTSRKVVKNDSDSDLSDEEEQSPEEEWLEESSSESKSKKGTTRGKVRGSSPSVEEFSQNSMPRSRLAKTKILESSYNDDEDTNNSSTVSSLPKRTRGKPPVLQQEFSRQEEDEDDDESTNKEDTASQTQSNSDDGNSQQSNPFNGLHEEEVDEHVLGMTNNDESDPLEDDDEPLSRFSNIPGYQPVTVRPPVINPAEESEDDDASSSDAPLENYVQLKKLKVLNHYEPNDSDNSDNQPLRPKRVNRLNYGENSDDDAGSENLNSNSVNSNNSSRTTTSSSRPRRGANSQNYFDSDENSVVFDQSVSVSSRGRVRKLTARARALLRE